MAFTNYLAQEESKINDNDTFFLKDVLENSRNYPEVKLAKMYGVSIPYIHEILEKAKTTIWEEESTKENKIPANYYKKKGTRRTNNFYVSIYMESRGRNSQKKLAHKYSVSEQDIKKWISLGKKILKKKKHNFRSGINDNLVLYKKVADMANAMSFREISEKTGYEESTLRKWIKISNNLEDKEKYPYFKEFFDVVKKNGREYAKTYFNIPSSYECEILERTGRIIACNESESQEEDPDNSTDVVIINDHEDKIDEKNNSVENDPDNDDDSEIKESHDIVAVKGMLTSDIYKEIADMLKENISIPMSFENNGFITCFMTKSSIEAFRKDPVIQETIVNIDSGSFVRNGVSVKVM